jgi:hypothetical protein
MKKTAAQRCLANRRNLRLWALSINFRPRRRRRLKQALTLPPQTLYLPLLAEMRRIKDQVRRLLGAQQVPPVHQCRLLHPHNLSPTRIRNLNRNHPHQANRTFSLSTKLQRHLVCLYSSNSRPSENLRTKTPMLMDMGTEMRTRASEETLLAPLTINKVLINKRWKRNRVHQNGRGKGGRRNILATIRRRIVSHFPLTPTPTPPPLPPSNHLPVTYTSNSPQRRCTHPNHLPLQEP